MEEHEFFIILAERTLAKIRKARRNAPWLGELYGDILRKMVDSIKVTKVVTDVHWKHMQDADWTVNRDG